MVDDDYPQELNDVFRSFDSKLSTAEKTLQPLFKNQRCDLTREMEPLEIAKLDLVTAYAVNSFYWTYLIASGVNPKTHPVKQELDRIKTYMGKVNEIENRKNAPRLEKEAAKRFIRSAMFDSDDKKKDEDHKPTSTVDQPKPSAPTSDPKTPESSLPKQQSSNKDWNKKRTNKRRRSKSSKKKKVDES
nr:nuclear nucleic acid-binding protein C1D [Ciona intestinalis]|eukprot:XP_002128345.1 nuclear nucleic acid-binding protein C1D [Ciona intestinalis]